jgi:hypothetical protein
MGLRHESAVMQQPAHPDRTTDHLPQCHSSIQESQQHSAQARAEAKAEAMLAIVSAKYPFLDEKFDSRAHHATLLSS